MVPQYRWALIHYGDGNLVSNTIIVILSLSVSLAVAVASLVFLVFIHKLEYFLNAYMVGTQVHAHAWELLLAMALTRSGIAWPPHCLFDTLDFARRLYPIWPSHSLESLEVQGVAYVVAHCHQSGAERTYRLDRIQRCWLE
jgi:hypothetical protein